MSLVSVVNGKDIRRGIPTFSASYGRERSCLEPRQRGRQTKQQQANRLIISTFTQVLTSQVNSKCCMAQTAIKSIDV